MLPGRALLLIVPVLAVGLTAVSEAEAQGTGKHKRACPEEMVLAGATCIDRWEVSTVDARTGAPLSPFYPPHPNLIRRVLEVWDVERDSFGSPSARRMPLPDLPRIQRTEPFEPKAVSQPGVVPQGYFTYYLAKQACENAGKRLCTEEEWVTACRGARDTPYPYGGNYSRFKCNVHRFLHPAFVLHGNSSAGHTDPRLNLIDESGRDPLLRLTGATPDCASRWPEGDLYDMVGNLDEWIADASGVFVGGFYSRATDKGCEARIASHSPSYYDYSLGTRCCRDPQR